MATMLRVPFGERDGKMLPPSEVPRGLSCKCRCPGCGATLIAKYLTKSGRYFFAHHNTPECPGGWESALHKMAKQIIQEEARVLTGWYSVAVSVAHQGEVLSDEVVFAPKEVVLSEIKLERKVDKWVPDITAILKIGKPIHIEIRVTHQVEKEKSKELDNVLEIDLRSVNRSASIDKAALRKIVLYDAPRLWHRCSLFNRHGEVYKRIEELKEQVELENRLKAKYQTHIKKLKSMQDEASRASYWENKRQEVSFKAAEAWLSGRQNKIKLTEKSCLWGIPMSQMVDIPIKNDWVFNVHRKVWQARLIFGFIYYPDGTRRKKTISLGPVYHHIQERYPLHDWLVELSELNERDLLKVAGCGVPSAKSVISTYLHYLARSDVNLLQPIGRRDSKDGLFQVLDTPLQ